MVCRTLTFTRGAEWNDLGVRTGVYPGSDGAIRCVRGDGRSGHHKGGSQKIKYDNKHFEISNEKLLRATKRLFYFKIERGYYIIDKRFLKK